MAFKGAVGVSIIIISLFASAILGVLINVNQEDVLKDVDTYVSDVTGLYASSSKDKTYTLYNPAKNYNGYSISDTSRYAVQATASQSGNNYPLYYEIPPIVNSYSALTTGSTYYPSSNPAIVMNGDYGIYYYSSSLGGWYNHKFETIEGNTGYETGPSYGTYTRLISLSNYIQHVSQPNLPLIMDFSYNVVDATLSGSGSVTTNVHASDSAIAIVKMTETDSGVGFYQTDDGGAYIIRVPSTNSNIPLYRWSGNPYSSSFFENTGRVTFTISYNPDTGLINGEVNGNTIFLAEDPTTYLIVVQRGNTATGYQGTTTLNVTRNVQITNTSIQTSTPIFIDPRYGVTPRPNTSTRWSNGYVNGSMHITAYLGEMDRDGNGIYEIGGLETQKEISWTFTHEDGNTSKLTLYHVANSNTYLNLMYHDIRNGTDQFVLLSQTNLGTNWIAFDIILDFINSNVSVQPISTGEWNSFTQWDSNQEIIDVGQFEVLTTQDGHDVRNTVKSPVTDITILNVYNNDLQTVAMQITDTTVFLKTYGVVMIDPYVDITKWYPNNEHFKMKYTGLTMYGTSIVINNVSYEVIDNTVKIGNDYVNISEFEIEFEKENDVYTLTVSSLKNDTYAVIEDVNNLNIEFKGNWYFVSKYYTVSEEWIKQMIWEPIKGVAYGLSGIILIMLALNVILGVLVWKFVPGMMELPDIVILIGTEIILFMVLT